MTTGLYYATVEDIERAMDIKTTARMLSQVRQELEASSRTIEGAAYLNRKFYPSYGTRYKNWPDERVSRSYRLWLDQDEAISLSLLQSGGVTIPASDYFLEPANSGPPYNRIEIDLSSSSAFAAGDTTQRAVAMTGVFGHSDVQADAGVLSAAVSSATATTVDVSDSSQVGIGNLLTVDSERLIVTGKTMIDTGQNCSTLTASLTDVSITGITAGTIAVDEVLLVDSERMLVVDVAGTTVTVIRQWGGTVLAAHTTGADIYAQRRLTVTRGAVGSSASTHSSSTAVTRLVVPGPVQELCVAMTVVGLLQRQSGYARTAGAGENQKETSGRGLKTALDAAMSLRRNRTKAAV